MLCKSGNDKKKNKTQNQQQQKTKNHNQKYPLPPRTVSQPRAAECIQPAVTLESVGQRAGRGGGLSCQSHTGAPPPPRLEAQLPATGRRGVPAAPALLLTARVFLREAQARPGRPTASSRRSQPSDVVRRRDKSCGRPARAPAFQELTGPRAPLHPGGGHRPGSRRPGAGSRPTHRRRPGGGAPRR